MTGPFGRLAAEHRRRILWVSGAAALALWIFLAVQDREMSDTAGPGIIPFEVAGTEEEAREILDDWGEEGQNAARRSLIADFPYLIAYAVFLAAGCTVAAGRFAARGWSGVARLGAPLGWAMFAAGAFDAIENVALLRVLDGNLDPWPGIALFAAIPKFALTGIGIAYVIAGAVLGRRARSAEARADASAQ